MQLIYKVFLLYLLTPMSVVFSQVMLEGSTEFIPYQGSQPRLIKGISQEFAINTPAIRHVYLADTNIIGIIIDSQFPERYSYLPYIRESNDSIVLQGYEVPRRLAKTTGTLAFINQDQDKNGLERLVYRNGTVLGWLIGQDYQYYWPVGALKGESLNQDAIGIHKNYSLTTTENGLSVSSLHPDQVFYKTKPHTTVRLASGNYPATRNEIFLKFSEPLRIGEKYTIEFHNNLSNLSTIHFTTDDKSLRTEALHVNLAGYHPNQSTKSAYLSTWLGDGGSLDYTKNKTFYLIDAENKEIAFEGTIALKTGVEEKLIHLSNGFASDNFSKTNVYNLDFSLFSGVGKYQVYLPRVGVSFPFRITRSVFKDAFKLQMKGYYHQRSGVAMEHPLYYLQTSQKSSPR